MSKRENEPGHLADEAFYAQLRDLARGDGKATGRDAPLAAHAAKPDEPLELTAVVRGAETVPVPMKPKSLAERLSQRVPGSLPVPPAAAIRPEAEDEARPEADDEHSIAGVLSRLDARERDLSAAGRGVGTPVSGRPLDQIVEDVLRPILADWLDRNLERIVRDQVDVALQAEVAARERGRRADD